MTNRKKREKLGDLFFELCKYSGTIIVVGKFINRDIDLLEFSIGIILSISFGVISYAVTPKDQGRGK